MFEKGGEVFSIPRGEGKESEETEEKSGEIEFLTYDNEKEYKSKEMPNDPDGFERGKGNLLVLERLRARSLGRKVADVIQS